MADEKQNGLDKEEKESENAAQKEEDVKASEETQDQNEPGETGEESEETEEIAEEAEEKKGLFGKKKEKKDKKTQQLEELTDRLKRTMAEFDNFRKRTDKEKSYMYENGARNVIEKILPVVDNFERAFKDITEEQLEDPFIDGMDKVYKQLMGALDELGVKPIETQGQPFDPDFHNAVMHVEDESLGENIIAEEFQKGYLYKETVVRHSMVKVAN